MARAVIVKMVGSEPQRYVPEEGCHLVIEPKNGCIVIEQQKRLDACVRFMSHQTIAVIAGNALATYED